MTHKPAYKYLQQCSSSVPNLGVTHCPAVGGWGSTLGPTSTYQPREKTTSVYHGVLKYTRPTCGENTAKVTLYASTLKPLEKVRAKDTKQIRGREVSPRAPGDRTLPSLLIVVITHLSMLTVHGNKTVIYKLHSEVLTLPPLIQGFSMYSFSLETFMERSTGLPCRPNYLTVYEPLTTGGTPTLPPTTEIPLLGVISGYLSPKQWL